MNIISFCNIKGGVTKSTSSMTIGYELARAGQRVLLIDNDPQGSLSLLAGFDPDDKTVGLHYFDEALFSRDPQYLPLQFKDIIYPINPPKKPVAEWKCDIVISNLLLSLAEERLVSAELARTDTGKLVIDPVTKNPVPIIVSNFGKIQELLETVKDEYDFCIIDCMPYNGILTYNALYASDYVIIPVSTQYLGYRGIDLIYRIINQFNLDLKQSGLDRQITVLGSLATLYRAGTNHSQAILREIQFEFRPAPLGVIAVIPQTVQVQDSIFKEPGRPITEVAPASPVSLTYLSVVDALLAYFDCKPLERRP